MLSITASLAKYYTKLYTSAYVCGTQEVPRGKRAHGPEVLKWELRTWLPGRSLKGIASYFEVAPSIKQTLIRTYGDRPIYLRYGIFALRSASAPSARHMPYAICIRPRTWQRSGVGNGGAGGARAPLSFRSRGLSPPQFLSMSGTRWRTRYYLYRNSTDAQTFFEVRRTM